MRDSSSGSSFTAEVIVKPSVSLHLLQQILPRKAAQMAGGIHEDAQLALPADDQIRLEFLVRKPLLHMCLQARHAILERQPRLCGVRSIDASAVRVYVLGSVWRDSLW